MKFIDGPLYPIRLKIVTQKVVKKKVGKECYGLFVIPENCIYLAKDQTHEQAVHTMLHELMHAAEHQLAVLDEEAKADIMATWLIRFFKIRTLDRLVGA